MVRTVWYTYAQHKKKSLAHFCSQHHGPNQVSKKGSTMESTIPENQEVGQCRPLQSSFRRAKNTSTATHRNQVSFSVNSDGFSLISTMDSNLSVNNDSKNADHPLPEVALAEQKNASDEEGHYLPLQQAVVAAQNADLSSFFQDKIITSDLSCQPSITESENEWSYIEDNSVDDACERNNGASVPSTSPPSFFSTLLSAIVAFCDSDSDDPSDPNERTFSWVRISLCIVKFAPCFWFLPQLNVSTTTDRTIAYRLAILCAFLTLVQIATGIFFAVVFTRNDNEQSLENVYFVPNLWNPIFFIMAISVVGFALLFTVLSAARAVHWVQLSNLVRYYWIIQWLLPIEVFCALSLLDYHNVTEVWIKHWWTTPTFAWFSSRYCEGQENCDDATEQAQSEMTRNMLILFYCNFILGIIMSLLVSLTHPNSGMCVF